VRHESETLKSHFEMKGTKCLSRRRFTTLQPGLIPVAFVGATITT
jgi:hypothetical protein